MSQFGRRIRSLYLCGQFALVPVWMPPILVEDELFLRMSSGQFLQPRRSTHSRLDSRLIGLVSMDHGWRDLTGGIVRDDIVVVLGMPTFIPEHSETLHFCEVDSDGYHVSSPKLEAIRRDAV